MAFQPLEDVLQAATEARVEAATEALIYAVAMESAQDTLSCLKKWGIINEDTASRLALKLNDQLVKQKRHDGKQGVTVLQAEAEPKALPVPKPKRKPKRKQRPDADIVRYCPICLEEGVETRLSIGSCGCVKHWREVKRREGAR